MGAKKPKRSRKHTVSETPVTPAAPATRAASAELSWSKRLLWVLLGGLFFGFSQPFVLAPLGEQPVDPTGLTGLLAFFAFVPALVLMKGGGPKRGYWLGFFTLWPGYTIVLYWVVVAMTVFGRIPLVPSAMALLLLSGAASFYIAAAFGVTRILVQTFGWPQWIAFPVCLGAAYLLLNYGPVGGFPWGAPGYAFTGLPILLQGASLFGVYGLTVCIALVNAALAEVVVARRARRPLPRRPLAAAGGVIALLLAWGGFRLATEPTDLPTVKVGMLQGNIEQGIKNKSRQNARFIHEKYHRLQAEALERGAEIIVWPEAALPNYVRVEWDTLMNAGVVPGASAPVPPAGVVGAVAIEPYKDEETGQKRYHRYNSAVVTGPGLEVLGRFDKAHLVPFGEYVPWPLNRMLRQLVPGGTSPGVGLKPIEVPVGDRRIPVAATICYEGIFPEITRHFANDGAALMVNVTNDAWYGVSSAAIQHLRMYSMRAVESGRAVARAANTGITAWVDTRGRLHDMTRMYTDAAVVADVPLSDEVTPYRALGEWVALPCLLVTLGAWFFALLGRGFVRRERHPLEWAVGIAGVTLAAVAAGWYFVAPGVMGDEGAANRATVGAIGALLVGLGALSGRPWGRKAQLWVGSLAFVLCGLGVAFGAVIALPFALLGALLVGLAWRRKGAYVREVDPPKPEPQP